MGRGLRRSLAVVLALAALVLAGVALPMTAAALPLIPDCKNPPTPEVPGRGVVGFFEPAPAVLPPPGDPFAPGATTSIHDQYGYAGLRWSTYDLGCGPEAARSPEATVGTSISNWIFGIAKTAVAATGALLGAAYQPDFLGVFDPLVSKVVDALHHAVFDQWVTLALAATGFLLVWRARRSSLSGSAAAIGWALLVMVVATAVFSWPLAAGHAADRTVTSTMTTITGALSEHGGSGAGSASAQASGNLHEALLYESWLGGELGNAGSDVARRYGPALFDAQALTWREAAVLRQDPAAGQRIIEAKQAKFKATAAKIQAADPDAYEYLVGRRSDARVGYAVLSGFAVLCAVPFLVLSALLVLGALVIVRLAVMLFPMIAVLGLFPAMRGLVIGLGNTVAAAIVNSIVFGLGAAVMVKAFGVVMGPGTGLPGWLMVALDLLLTIVMWYTLRPFARLTHMVAPGASIAARGGPLGGATRGAGRFGGRVVSTALGVVLGESAAQRGQDELEQADEREPGRRGRQTPRRIEADTSAQPAYLLLVGRSGARGEGRGEGESDGARDGFEDGEAGRGVPPRGGRSEDEGAEVRERAARSDRLDGAALRAVPAVVLPAGGPVPGERVGAGAGAMPGATGWPSSRPGSDAVDLREALDRGRNEVKRGWVPDGRAAAAQGAVPASGSASASASGSASGWPGSAAAAQDGHEPAARAWDRAAAAATDGASGAARGWTPSPSPSSSAQSPAYSPAASSDGWTPSSGAYVVGELPGWHPEDVESDVLPRPIDPDDVGGEEVYVIYRPDTAGPRLDAKTRW